MAPRNHTPQSRISECAAIPSVRRAILPPRAFLPSPSQIDIRIFSDVLFRSPRADLAHHRRARRSVLKMVPVRNAGLESGAVAGSQQFLASIGDEHDFTV